MLAFLCHRKGSLCSRIAFEYAEYRADLHDLRCTVRTVREKLGGDRSTVGAEVQETCGGFQIEHRKGQW